jgi:hypothetical protein
LSIRHLVARALPVAVALTVACAIAYGASQQLLRSGANDPQIQLAEDAARALDAGAAPASVAGPGSAVAGLAGSDPVDIGVSLAPFLIVYDASGRVLAATGRLDGVPPVPPLGVLDTARSAGRDVVTWQPRSGVRIASVAVGWSGGSVLAGRSLREVEGREDQALLLAAAAWIAGMVLLAGAVLTAAWLTRDQARG